VSDIGIARGDFGLDRPLTWRGALYVIEGLRRDLQPEDFKRSFVGNGGLLEAPESDQVAYNTEFQKRVAANPACADREDGWGPRVKVITERLEAELKAERRTGWMLRAFPALDIVKARSEQWRDTYQREVDEAGDTPDQAKLQRSRGGLEYHTKLLAELEEHRAYLNGLLSLYPGTVGEEAFNAEIRKMGEAHLAWGAQVARTVERLLKDIQAQHLESAISEDDWSKILAAVKDTKSTFWAKTGDTRVLAKVEHSLFFQKHLDMAVREDLLDLYTRSKASRATLPTKLVADLQAKLRYVEPGLPHRMGGQANPVQGDADPSTPLLLQIASDRPMGWMWGDVGALYVTVSPDDLRRHRFGRIEAWIEGH
jgi:Domain of unknown function (DUF1963)